MEATKMIKISFLLSLIFVLFPLMGVCFSETEAIKEICLKDGAVIHCDVCWLDLGWLMNANAPVLYEQGEELKMIAINLVDLKKTFGDEIALKYEKTWAEKRRSQELLERAKELREQDSSNVAGTSFDFGSYRVDDFNAKRIRITRSLTDLYEITFNLTNVRRDSDTTYQPVKRDRPTLAISIVACTASGTVLQRTTFTELVAVGETVFCHTNMSLNKEREIPQFRYWDIEPIDF